MQQYTALLRRFEHGNATRVLHAGAVLTEAEVTAIVLSDLKLAAGAVAAVFVVLWVHTGSLWITANAMLGEKKGGYSALISLAVSRRTSSKTWSLIHHMPSCEHVNTLEKKVKKSWLSSIRSSPPLFARTFSRAEIQCSEGVECGLPPASSCKGSFFRALADEADDGMAGWLGFTLNSFTGTRRRIGTHQTHGTSAPKPPWTTRRSESQWAKIYTATPTLRYVNCLQI